MTSFRRHCRLVALLAGGWLTVPLTDLSAQQSVRRPAASVRRVATRTATGRRAVDAPRRPAAVARARTRAVPVARTVAAVSAVTESRIRPEPAPRSIVIAPVGSAMRIAVPIRSSGEFRADGLQSGRYRLVLASLPVDRQTQSATLGAPDSVVPAAALRAVPGPRLERVVNVGRLSRALALDADTMQVQVGMDGQLAGVVKPK